MAKRRAASKAKPQVDDFRHPTETRKNNPPAKIAAEGTVPAVPKATYSYSARRPPQLQFDPDGEYTALLRKARRQPLSEEEAARLEQALAAREPWLEWAEKREQHARGGFAVDPVALHIHERVSTQAILKVAQRQDVQKTLFADPEHEYHQAVQFYRYDIDWTNRLILGDSLQVMSSLAHRENLAGKVQMIYIDPPYGIKFASNFQPEVGRRDVKDKETDLTREPEMVKAYRDTWHLGIHSYLSYLRDRLIAARELLADTGSVFVQIGDENLHRVRMMMDEVFGDQNAVSLIAVKKASPLGSAGLTGAMDFLIWYCKDRTRLKYKQLYKVKDIEGDRYYSFAEGPSGLRHSIPNHSPQAVTINNGTERLFTSSVLLSSGLTPSCVFPVTFEGRQYHPTAGRSWRTNSAGMDRLAMANRLLATGKTLRYLAYFDDFAFETQFNLWSDTGGGAIVGQKQYVVQTPAKIIARCLLMTTDPGDLVLDPTCGSGTTAYVAEQWGRRWITIDTSRVAVAIARQRLLTAKFDMYRVKDSPGGATDGSRGREPTEDGHAPTPSPGGATGGSRGRPPTETDATKHASPGGATGSAPRAAAPPGLHAPATPSHRGLSPPATHSGPSGANTSHATPIDSAAAHLGAAHLGVDPHPGFVYRTVPHITLKSIAQNQNLDPIFAKLEPVLDEKLAACNAALADVTKALRDTLELKLLDKQRAEGARSITDADRRRWQLPAGQGGKVKAQEIKDAAKRVPSTLDPQPSTLFQHWTVPFDTDPDWPQSLQTAVTDYRQAWRGKMDAVNACIAANADQEELVDQPEPVKGVVRVSGPFTVEAVQPPELSLGDAVGLFEGAPGMIEGAFAVRPVEVFHETQNVTGYLDNMLRLMRIDGVRFPDNKQMQFTSLDPIYTHSGGSTLHAEGNWTPASGGREATEAASDARPTVAVVIGPQYGPITTKQVVEAIPIAFRRGYTDLVFAGFSFDAGAYAEVENQANPKIKLHLATIRPDVNPGMEGLLKEQPGSQLFTVFGQPRVTLAGPDKRGEYTVTMEGVDIYDPVNNVVQPTRADKVAAWFLDGDYDGRTFCITQAFFPDRGAWDKLERALNGKDGLIDEDKFAAFSGTTSLPFGPGKEGRVAVKVIDPRGNEVMWVREVGNAK